MNTENLKMQVIGILKENRPEYSITEMILKEDQEQKMFCLEIKVFTLGKKCGIISSIGETEQELITKLKNWLTLSAEQRKFAIHGTKSQTKVRAEVIERQMFGYCVSDLNADLENYDF